MEMNKKLCKLFFQFPAICIYGNEGDFSRYKILKKITNVFYGKDTIINKYIRDRVNVIIYPQKYGKSIMAVDNDEIYIFDKVDMLQNTSYSWILVPGSKSDSDEIVILPVTDINEKISNIREAVFVESFPFGKKEFCDYVLDFIKEQKITCCKKIILFDEDFKYGATDISDKSAGIEEINKKMSPYINDIYTMSAYKGKSDKVDIKRQYIQKKKSCFK